MRKPVGIDVFRLPGLRGRFIALCAAGILGCTSASSVLAADPASAVQSAASYSGTGIAVGNGGISTDLGIQAQYAQLKEAQLAALDAGTLSVSSLAPAKKMGAGATDLPAAPLTSAAAPMAIVSQEFPGFHQKTNYYCLVAFVQSVAYWDLDDYFMEMGQGSILGAQNKIYGTNLTNGIREYYPDTGTKKGASDAKAIAWINKNFLSYGYGFSYVAISPTSTSDFMNAIRLDNGLWYEVNYIRIDLTTYKYAWGQAKNSDGTHPLHATAATGYNDTAGTVTTFDPFSYSSAELSGPYSSCTSHSFNSTPNWGCVWTLTQGNYYSAVDRWDTDTKPMWY